MLEAVEVAITFGTAEWDRPEILAGARLVRPPEFTNWPAIRPLLMDARKIILMWSSPYFPSQNIQRGTEANALQNDVSVS